MNRGVFFVVLILVVMLLSGCVTHVGESSHCDRAREMTPSRTVVERAGGVIEVGGYFHVPADEEWVYSETVEIRAYGAIIIDGVIRGLPPSSNRIPAPSMTISSVTGIVVRGEIHAFPGADGNYPGGNGGDAGALYIHAPLLVINEKIIGGAGGAGYPDDGRGENRKRAVDEGRGGAGGLVEVYAQISGPYSEMDRDKEVATGYVDVQGGTGGYGGGTGGGVLTGYFRELPWMVKYRQDYLLKDSEIEAAPESGEID